MYVEVMYVVCVSIFFLNEMNMSDAKKYVLQTIEKKTNIICIIIMMMMH